MGIRTMLLDMGTRSMELTIKYKARITEQKLLTIIKWQHYSETQAQECHIEDIHTQHKHKIFCNLVNILIFCLLYKYIKSNIIIINTRNNKQQVINKNSKIMPKTNYNQVSFWQQKYKVTICEHYEWLCKPEGIFNSISTHLDYSKMQKVMEIGCGTSNFASKLKRQVEARQSQTDITCIDFSKQLIKKARSTKSTPGISYTCLDIRNMGTLPAESFDYIFDKGCLDCLFCTDSFTRQVIKALRECYKLLKDNGKLVIISHGKPKLRTHIFRNRLVPFDLKYEKIVKENKGQQGCFAYICTKKGSQTDEQGSGQVLPQHQNSDEEKEQKQKQQKKQQKQKPKQQQKEKQNEKEDKGIFILEEPGKKKKGQKKKKNETQVPQQAVFILPGQKNITGDFILKEQSSQQQEQSAQKSKASKEDKQGNKQDQANFILNEAEYQNQFDDE